MIKIGGLDLKGVKVTDEFASVVDVKKIAIGSEIIWEKSSGGLPSGYTEVEYLQSSGTQWIDTGIKCNNTYFKIELEYQKTNISRVDGMSGTRDINAKWGLYFYTGGNVGSQDGRIACAYGSQNVYLSGSNYADGKHKVSLEFTTTGLKTYVDEIYVSQNSYSELDTTLNYFIFGCNNNGTFDTTRNAQIKLYSFKMYDSNGVTRDFIPCLDPNDRPCMFDLVTQQPFYNQGTGEFLYGNII